jgi:hypothetical protein
MDSIEVHPAIIKSGAGIYTVGNPTKCYVRMFVTDTGRCIPVSGRCLSEEDLLQVYEWGRLDQQESPNEIDGKLVDFEDDPAFTWEEGS